MKLPRHLAWRWPDWLIQEASGVGSLTTAGARLDWVLHLARRNVEEGTGGPFGAAVFEAEGGTCLGVGVNLVRRAGVSLAHAEMTALATAQTVAGAVRLNQSGRRIVLATSAQPCAMCFGALFWAGLDEVLIGARREDVEQLAGFAEGPLPADWLGDLRAAGIRVRRDLRRREARAVLRLYRDSGGPLY